MQQESKPVYFKVAPNVWGIRDLFVNLYIVRNPDDENWVLIDAGLKTAARKIKKLVSDLFGPHSRPAAILLTHGHFDHVGSLKELAKEWNVPVYAHHLEAPYLTDKSDYPPPDPSVGGGLMADLSWLYPKSPINIENRLQLLPPDDSVPFLPGWKAIHTPGHAPGHVSFFREQDKLLIAGDAIVTTKQESAWYVLLQKLFLSGPPKYFTYDWKASGDSVKRLADLNPSIIATGHGKPMAGSRMQQKLHELADHFHELAVPKQGRYVNQSAIADDNGVVYLPPTRRSVSWTAAIIFIIILFLLFWLFW